MDKIKLSINERECLLEVAKDIANNCKNNNESKEDTEQIILHCLKASAQRILDLRTK
jgi:hypothetical protein